jgi:hypothetical protein
MWCSVLSCLRGCTRKVPHILQYHTTNFSKMQ